MRLCIPVAEGTGPSARVSARFGRAPRFAFASTEGGVVETVSSVDSGDHHVAQLEAARVEAVVCQRLGWRAYRALRQAAILVLVGAAPDATVSEVIEAARAGRLRCATGHEVCRAGTGRDRPPRGGAQPAPRS